MTEQQKAAAPAPTNDEIRVHFEASIRGSRVADSTPLGTIDLNGKFHHYADSDTDTMWLGYRAGYLRALRAARAADAVPTEREGWRWVPMEPTPGMLAAFSEASCKWVQELGDDRDVYRAMLAAAPQPASEPQPAAAKLPDFAASVAQRKWDDLKADGWRMTRIEFERPESTSTGSIDPSGVVTWKHQEREPQPAPVGVDASGQPWRLWRCNQETGRDWLVKSSTDENWMRGLLKRALETGADAWLISPTGEKITGVVRAEGGEA